MVGRSTSDDAARAVSRRARRRAHDAQSDGRRRGRRRRTAWSSVTAGTSGRVSRTPKCNALDDAGDRARGGTLYVTLEPCCHTGRTGPCTRRIIEAGVARVVAAMTDPDPRVSGRGFDELRATASSSRTALCEPTRARLNAAFVTVKAKQRPLVVLKAATSLDACVAAGPGAPHGDHARGGESPNADSARVGRRHGDRLGDAARRRSAADGARVPPQSGRSPAWSSTAGCGRRRRPGCSRPLAEGPVIIVTGSQCGDAAGTRDGARSGRREVIEASSLADALQALAARDVSTVLVEGGPTLQAALVRESARRSAAPDRRPTRARAPAASNGWGPRRSTRLRSRRSPVEPRGPDVWIEADVHGHR